VAALKTIGVSFPGTETLFQNVQQELYVLIKLSIDKALFRHQPFTPGAHFTLENSEYPGRIVDLVEGAARGRPNFSNLFPFYSRLSSDASDFRDTSPFQGRPL